MSLKKTLIKTDMNKLRLCHGALQGMMSNPRNRLIFSISFLFDPTNIMK